MVCVSIVLVGSEMTCSVLFLLEYKIDRRGQFSDGKISLQDEISVSMDEAGVELMRDLQRNNKHYEECISECLSLVDTEGKGG